jgi:hypothetical protein
VVLALLFQFHRLEMYEFDDITWMQYIKYILLLYIILVSN